MKKPKITDKKRAERITAVETVFENVALLAAEAGHNKAFSGLTLNYRIKSGKEEGDRGILEQGLEMLASLVVAKGFSGYDPKDIGGIEQGIFNVDNDVPCKTQDAAKREMVEWLVSSVDQRLGSGDEWGPIGKREASAIVGKLMNDVNAAFRDLGPGGRG